MFNFVPSIDVPQVYKWLVRESNVIEDRYKYSIGLIWYCSLEESYKYSPVYQESSKSISALKYPLVINWLLTGRCTHKCKYCYAFDLREVPEIIDSEKSADSIIDRILSYHPIAVVLSGGEPILCKYLSYIVDKLYQKTGVILDTNGHLLNSELALQLKSRNVVVRISIDTFIPKNERIVRSMGSETLDNEELCKTMSALNACLEIDIPVVVHTVVTDKNINDLDSMGEKLYSLNVHVWKLMELSKLGRSQLNKLYRNIEEPIDSSNPFQPSLDSIYRYIDLWEHRNRYIDRWN